MVSRLSWIVENFWIFLALASVLMLLYYFARHYIFAWAVSRGIKKELPDLTLKEIEHCLRYYIRPLCQNLNPGESEESRHIYPVKSDLRTTVEQWLTTDTVYRNLIILSEAGMGKTAFLINYIVYQYTRRYKPFEFVYIPFGLSGFAERIESVEQPERTVLLLDGFNEDMEAVQDRIGRIDQIIKWTSLFYRVIITCRTSFFPRDKDIPFDIEKIRPGFHRIGIGPQYTFYTLYISPFNDKQVKAYLKRRFPIWNKKKRQKAFALVEQRANPVVHSVLLTYIEDLMESEELWYNKFQMYSTLVSAWIAKKHKMSQIRESMHVFFQKLAIELFTNRLYRGREYIAKEELESLAIKNNIQLSSWDYPSLIIQSESCYYKFIHRSMLEFLFAKGLLVNDFEAVSLPVSQWTELITKFFIQGVYTLKKMPRSIQNFFVPINGGIFQMGVTGKIYEIHPFEMSAFPITNSEYEAFSPSHSHLRDTYSSEDDQPVVHVSWDDALRYCQWLSKKTGQFHRLPKESEWEFAASGGGFRLYPWGNEVPNPELANFEGSEINKTTYVGAYPKGMTPEGLFDLAGNVWEWCDDWFNSKKVGKVVRGGAFFNDEDYLLCSFRARSLPLYRSNSLGFRIVRPLYPETNVISG